MHTVRINKFFMFNDRRTIVRVLVFRSERNSARTETEQNEAKSENGLINYAQKALDRGIG